MNRMIEDARRRLESTFAPYLEPWFVRSRGIPELPQVRPAYADLIDAGKEYRVSAEVPGIPKENLNVTVTNREIKIEGEAKTDRQQENEGFVQRERAYSKISRSLTFPEEVLPEKAEATLNNGLLEVRIPKRVPTEVKLQKVQVK
jgi:HSP20 family protein